MRALVVLALAASPALGDADSAALDVCVQAATEARQCTGQLTKQCVATTPDGDTTIGTSECIQREAAAWDALLNREYKLTRARFAEADASGDLLTPDATRVDALQTAQRAWIAFRDAECGLQYVQWGTGSIRVIAAGNCILEETAERTMELKAMRGE